MSHFLTFLKEKLNNLKKKTSHTSTPRGWVIRTGILCGLIGGDNSEGDNLQQPTLSAKQKRTQTHKPPHTQWVRDWHSTPLAPPSHSPPVAAIHEALLLTMESFFFCGFTCLYLHLVRVQEIYFQLFLPSFLETKKFVFSFWALMGRAKQPSSTNCSVERLWQRYQVSIFLLQKSPPPAPFTKRPQIWSHIIFIFDLNSKPLASIWRLWHIKT